MTSERWAKPTIVGKRVTIRPFLDSDIDAIWEMLLDPEGNDLTATDETFEFDQIKEWYRTRNDQDNRLDLAIVENETGEWAGEVVLNEYSADAGSCSFRISLRGPGWFGRGLGTEATDLITSHGFETIGLHHIHLEVLARNPRAMRSYEKTGFRETRRFAEDGEDWVEMRLDSPTTNQR